MSQFSERIKKNGQVMVACLLNRETKAELDKIAKATRRSKSGCMELAIRHWLYDEKKRIKSSVAEVVM